MLTAGTILVLDLGTTYFKFTLFDRDARACTTSRLTLSADEGPGREAVLSAEEFDRLLTAGLHELRLRDRVRFEDIQVVTFASQANCFLLLDEQERPLTPLILWFDRRGERFVEEARRLFTASELHQTTGVPDLGYEFMLTKLLWLREHEPELCERASRLCLLSDYLILLLTGKHVTEAGLAGLTGLMDVNTCEWLTELASSFRIAPEWLGTIVRPGTHMGTISPAAAAHWSLPAWCRVVVGCLDQYAGAIGAGSLEPGRVSETTGTVLASVRCVDRLADAPPAGVFQGPSFSSDLHFQMVFGDTSAALLESLHNQASHHLTFDELIDHAAFVPAGAEGLRLKAGASTTAAEDMFEGLAPRHTPAHRTRCVLEAVALALRDQVCTLCGNHLPDEIRSLGGAARSRLWLQIKADVLGISVCPIDCPEPTSLGAAILAEATLQGVDPRQVAARWVRPGRRLLPDPGRHEAYRKLGL